MNQQTMELPSPDLRYQPSAPSLDRSPSPVACAIPLLLAILLGFVLRGLLLGEKPLWEDEGWTFNVAVDKGEIFDVTGLDLHPLTFYSVWRNLPAFCYHSDFGFRLPSLVFSCISVVLWAIALTLADVDKRIRVWCVLAFALLPMNIRYAQEARAYALTQMLALAALTAYLWAMKAPTIGRLVVLALAIAASCHIDGYGMATPFAIGLHALWQAFRNQPARRLVYAILCGTALAAPYYYVRLHYIISHHSAHTIAEGSNLWLGLISRFVQLSPLGINADQLPEGFQWTIYLLSAGIIGLLMIACSTPKSWIPVKVQSLFWILFVVPLAVLLAGSFAVNHNLIHIKYVLICVPGILPLLVAGAMRLFPGRRIPLYLFLFLIPLTVSAGWLKHAGSRADWRTLFARMEPRLKEGDGFIQLRERNYPLYSFGSMRVYMWRKGLDFYAPENYIEYAIQPMPGRTKIPLDNAALFKSADDPQALTDFARSRPSHRVWTFTTGWMADWRELDLASIATPVATVKADDIKATLWEVH